MILFDTDVMIGLLRDYGPAKTWLERIASETIGLPGLVAMELIQGCRDNIEQARLQSALQPYALYWPNQADCWRAYADFYNFRLSHNLGLIDALIAETVIGMRAQLAIFNVKHYRVLESLHTIRPYRRASS